MGEASTVKELEKLPITSRGGAPVYRKILLGDVADIKDDLDDIRRISRFNGKPTVGLGIMKQRRSNTIAVAEEVRKLTADLQTRLPEGYSVAISHDMTKVVKDSPDELVFTIILSTILTGIVCLVFLGSFSSTFNILLAIPTSIMGSFIFLYFGDSPSITFTLLALSLAIGIVVDDAIMVMEHLAIPGDGTSTAWRRPGSGRDRSRSAAIAATLAVNSDIPARGVHEGYNRQIFPRVRHHDYGGRGPLPPRGADAYTGCDAHSSFRSKQHRLPGTRRQPGLLLSSRDRMAGRSRFILDHRWTVIMARSPFYGLLIVSHPDEERVRSGPGPEHVHRGESRPASAPPSNTPTVLPQGRNRSLRFAREVLRYFSAVGGSPAAR